MRSAEKLENEIWERHKAGQKPEVISRALRIHVNAVRNIIEDRKILGEPKPFKKVNSRPSIAKPISE